MFASMTPLYQAKVKMGPLQQKFTWSVHVRMSIKRCSLLAIFFGQVFTSWLAENFPNTSMPLGMIQEAESPTSQDSCLARIGVLTSSISLATMARAPRSHHLYTDHLQNISALTSLTTLFLVFPMMDILALCNFNDVKDHGPIIPCLLRLCMRHLSSPSTSITHQAPSNLHSPIVAASRNKYNKIYVNDQIAK
jgi:hypothetical protein